jgi:hypothetical protein
MPEGLVRSGMAMVLLSTCFCGASFSMRSTCPMYQADLVCGTQREYETAVLAARVMSSSRVWRRTPLVRCAAKFSRLLPVCDVCWAGVPGSTAVQPS